MKNSPMLMAALLAVLSLTPSTWPQRRPVNVAIDPTGEHSRVYLSYMDSTAQAHFSGVFRSPMELEYKPYSLLLNNVSRKAIVSVNVRWLAISAGEIGFFDSSINSILPGMPGGSGSLTRIKVPGQRQSTQTPVKIGGSDIMAQGSEVAANGERMLVAPGLFARESVGRSGGGAPVPEEIKTADTVSAILDTVILEDGEVLGPDASHTVDSLRTSKAGVDAVLQAVRDAEQRGEDGVEALRRLARPPRGPQDSQLPVQLRIFISSLMTSRNWKDRLEKMSAIQLPNFHR